jgi:membrane protein YdbS with pleckstrin-like domain
MNFIRQKIIDTYSRGGEEIHHSFFAVIPRFMIFFLYLLLIEILYWMFPDAMWYLAVTFTGAFILLTVTLFAAFVIRPVISLYNSYHEITEDNLISVQGFASFSRREYLCPLIFINGIEVRQNIFERLTNMGNIFIGTSMTGHAEIVLKHVDRPQYYASKLEEAIDHAIED